MKIFMCVKPVPDTTAKIKVSDGAKIDPAGVKFELSAYDPHPAIKALIAV